MTATEPVPSACPGWWQAAGSGRAGTAFTSNPDRAARRPVTGDDPDDDG